MKEKSPFLKFFAFICYFFLYLPLIVIVVFSFNSDRFPAPWKSFTFDWYKELIFSSGALWDSFGISLQVAFCSTILSLIMSLMFLYWVAHGAKLAKWTTLFYGNLIIPEIVLAVALLSFFTIFHIPLGYISLIISHTLLGLGFSLPILYSRYSQLDPKLYEASLVLGATIRQTFFKVAVPQLKSALFSTALLVFVLSFDDFVLSYFCAGSQSQTLSLYLLSMLRSEVSPVVNALSSILLIISTSLALVYFTLSKRGEEKKHA
jgi:spermidine/putrescine transport system permease protein